MLTILSKLTPRKLKRLLWKISKYRMLEVLSMSETEGEWYTKGELIEDYYDDLVDFLEDDLIEVYEEELEELS